MYRVKTRRARDRSNQGSAPPTVTWHLPCETEQAPDPVLSFRGFPTGRTFYLDSYRWEDLPRRWMSLGRHADRVVVINDPTVSRLHAFLARNRHTGHVYILDESSYNGTWVNGLEVLDGMIEVTSGSLVQLGGAMLLACGHLGVAQRPLVSGTTLHKILETAIGVYGGQERAAKAWRIPQSTLSRWLDEGKFDVPEAWEELSQALDTIPDCRGSTYGSQP